MSLRDEQNRGDQALINLLVWKLARGQMDFASAGVAWRLLRATPQSITTPATQLPKAQPSHEDEC